MDTMADTETKQDRFGDRSTFIDVPENDIGGSSQFVGNFLETQGDLEHIVKNKVFVTSDTHFSHKNILIYEAENRPFKDRDEMDEALIERWNEKVKPCDVVIHLGDFAFAGYKRIKELVSRLNGRKFLLLGNHDRFKKFNWIELGFERVFRTPFKMDGKFVFSHEPLAEIPAGMVNIYGHVHGNGGFLTRTDNSFCACVERHGCAPVDYDAIKALF